MKCKCQEVKTATLNNKFKTVENRTRTDKNYTEYRTISNNLMMYQEGVVLSSTTKKKKHNKEKDEEKSQLNTEEGEEKARIKGKKDHANLDWLDSIENMLSDEEKALVEKNR